MKSRKYFRLYGVRYCGNGGKLFVKNILMSCHSEQCHHGSKEHLKKNVCQANLWQFSRSSSEFYFEGNYRQDGDGDIVFVAISQTIYVFCESSSLSTLVYYVSNVSQGNVWSRRCSNDIFPGALSKISSSFLKSARK